MKDILIKISISNKGKKGTEFHVFTHLNGFRNYWSFREWLEKPSIEKKAERRTLCSVKAFALLGVTTYILEEASELLFTEKWNQ